MNRDIILYLHIPKSGGSTLSTCIYNEYRSESEYKEEEGLLCSGVYYYPQNFFKPTDPSPSPSIKKVLARGDLRAVTGHFCFGIHRHVSGPSRYATMLRDPVERMLSLYSHIHRWYVEPGWTPKERWVARELIGQRMSFSEFATYPGLRELDNDQCRRIAGEEPAFGEASPALLEKAKLNLDEHFAAVGIMEYFDESLELFRRRFGWRFDASYTPKLVNPVRLRREELSDEGLHDVVSRNRYDMALYEYAKQKFEHDTSTQVEQSAK